MKFQTIPNHFCFTKVFVRSSWFFTFFEIMSGYPIIVEWMFAVFNIHTDSFSPNFTTSNASPFTDKTRQLLSTLQDLSLCAQMVPQTPLASFGRANPMRYHSFLELLWRNYKPRHMTYNSSTGLSGLETTFYPNFILFILGHLYLYLYLVNEWI